MKEIKNFDDFYNIKVLPNIHRFQQEDKGADNWGVIMIVALMATLVSFILNMNVTLEWNNSYVTTALFIFTIYSFYSYTRKDDAYIDDFKQSVIKEIIDYLQPGLQYEPSGMMPEKEYRQSGLYRWRYTYYEGDDYIAGTYKGVSFHCSEVRAYVTGSRSRLSGWDALRGIDRDGDVFKGLFFAATVNSRFTGGTYIWIKGKEQLGVTVGDEAYRMLRFPQTVHIHTGNALFDEYYTVYSTNPAEAHTIVTTELMNSLVRFRNQLQRNVVLSVVLGKCYVAVPVKEDLFEPEGAMEDKEAIKKHFFSVLLLLSIINQLNLARLQ